MRLRHWQQEAIEAALTKFSEPYTHFLCLATPGSGKTLMASALADILIEEEKVDLVLCFSPSTVVANDFKVELETITSKRFCGGLGASGSSMTYQSMRHLNKAFWSLLNSNRVFVIFDEIHHCAGGGLEDSNAWGAEILKHIQGKAHFTIALTGTPWRSDSIPIVLSNYVGEGNRIYVDYRYDLKQAIKDGVCRTPKLISLDTDLIGVIEGSKKTNFKSITDFVAQSDLPYFELIKHDEVIRKILEQGIAQLDQERSLFSDAGGLIVAASISHAKHIHRLLSELGEYSEVVNYREHQPSKLIKDFKSSSQKWIISVNMISEGTNIPRLRVCCYLSLITTELYFRQVLGRVLRTQYSSTEVGYVILPAHPRLIEFATRIAEEIPHHATFQSLTIDKKVDLKTSPSLVGDNITSIRFEPNKTSETLPGSKKYSEHQQGPLASWYDSTIDSFGRFHKHVFTL